MHAVVRSYSGQGAAQVFDVIEEKGEDVKSLLSGVPGFVSYVAFRNGDGGTTVTVCDDKAGTDESSQRAAGFIKENLGETGSAPAITEGTTVLQFGS